MKKKVISDKNLPTKMPLHTTLTVILAIKAFDIQSFWVGVLAVLFVCMWIGWISEVIKREDVDITDKL